MTAFRIEPAYAGDLPEIKALLRTGNLSDNLSQCRFVLKAFARGGTVGGVGLEFWRGFVSLRGLIVAKPLKRRGIGKALVAEAVRIAQTAGTEGIYAYTLFWNIRFFSACGFVRIPKEEAPAAVADSADFHYPHYRYCCLMEYQGGSE